MEQNEDPNSPAPWTTSPQTNLHPNLQEPNYEGAKDVLWTKIAMPSLSCETSGYSNLYRPTAETILPGFCVMSK